MLYLTNEVVPILCPSGHLLSNRCPLTEDYNPSKSPKLPKMFDLFKCLTYNYKQRSLAMGSGNVESDWLHTVSFDCFHFAMNTVYFSSFKKRNIFITQLCRYCKVIYVSAMSATCEILRCLSRGWTEIPGLPSVCPHNAQTKAWNLRAGMSLRAETINGRMNDRLITTPTKPAEHNPWGAKGAIICHCTEVFYTILILNFICRVPISSVLNIAFVNNSRGHMCATQSSTELAVERGKVYVSIAISK